jgi:hypothetical protein
VGHDQPQGVRKVLLKMLERRHFVQPAKIDPFAEQGKEGLIVSCCAPAPPQTARRVIRSRHQTFRISYVLDVVGIQWQPEFVRRTRCTEGSPDRVGIGEHPCLHLSDWNNCDEAYSLTAFLSDGLDDWVELLLSRSIWVVSTIRMHKDQIDRRFRFDDPLRNVLKLSAS